MILPVGLFPQHSLQITLHHDPTAIVAVTCPSCKRVTFEGKVRDVLYVYRDHVMDTHFNELEECGCCGCYHFPASRGDCREDWERF